MNSSSFFRPTVARPAAACLVAAVAMIAAGCSGGGGSSAPPKTLGGNVLGLKTGGEVRLSAAGVSQSFTTSAFTFTSVFDAGTAYTVAVERHPLGQRCAVVRNGSGTFNAAVGDVQVECYTEVLNDTGTDAALRPDGSSGRDAEASRLVKVGAGAAGFDFTRLCSGGETVANGICPAATPPAVSNTWTCTRDNVTGLVWTSASGLYTGAETPPAGRVCGVDGWRLPTAHELVSLVHAGRGGPPYVDADYFTAASMPYASAETYRDGTGAGWVVHFGELGAVGKYIGGQRHVRWVSGTPTLADPASSAWSRRAAGTASIVVDARRELMWLQPGTLPLLNWADAVSSVATVNAGQPGGFDDWRLPNRNELDSLVRRDLDSPALDPVVLGTAAAASYAQVFWTSTPKPGSGTEAWVVDLKYGDISPFLKTAVARVVYVRNRAFNVQQ